MRLFVGLGIIGLILVVIGWQAGVPQIIRPGLWMIAPFVATFAFGIVSALVSVRGGAQTATYLRVSFREKDEAKALGARWDPKRRSWYVPAGADTAGFARWLPSGAPPAPEAPSSRYASMDVHEEDEADGSSVTFDSSALLFLPIYAAESSTSCWKCRSRTPVVALATERAEIDGEPIQELVLASNVQKLRPELAAEVSKMYPRYRPAYSKTAGGRYYMNHCSACDAKLGDFFLHEELGGAFFPTNARAASNVILRRLPVSRSSQVSATFSLAARNLLHRYAQRPPA
jgi:hypothetical protein